METKEDFESAKPPSLVIEPCLLPKHDIELDLEFVREFDLEIIDKARPRVVVTGSSITSSLVDQAVEPKSDSIGDSKVSLICCRPFVLKSANREVTATGDSALTTGLGEFEFVFGFESRLW